jgi:signal transduction histidine kinase
MDFVSSTYQKFRNIDYNSENFYDELRSIQQENIYITYYDCKENKILYSSVNSVNIEINTKAADFLFKTPLTEEYYVAPNSTGDSALYEITGRKQQTSVVGPYTNGEEWQYLILQYPSQPIDDIVSVTGNYYFISYIVIFFLSIPATSAILYSINKPLKEATSVARKIKNKDFSERCIIRTNDEIAELEEAINMMADSIDDYTSELKTANQTLSDDVNKMKKMDKMQKDFISNVSHEIKTPISIISGSAEAIKQDVPSTLEERNEFCDIIIDECARMTDMVVQLLNLSKLESGAIELDYSDCDVSEMCAIVISKFKPKCKKENINIDLNADKEYFVRADYNEIEKVIINFIQNAYKHVSSNGTITVNVKKDGEYVYVGVNNDGAHIDEDEIENVWVKFYKLDK